MADKELNKLIGNRLKELRGDMPLRYVAPQLMNKSGKPMSVPGYLKIENGEVALSIENARILGKMYGVQPSYILCEEEYRTEEEADDKAFSDHFLSDQKILAFLRSLGVYMLPTMVTSFYDTITGKEIPLEEVPETSNSATDYPIKSDAINIVSALVPPTGENVRKEKRFYATVRLKGNEYLIPAEIWKSIVEVTFKSAIASLEVSCSRFDIKEEDHGKH